METDEKWMQLALEEACLAGESDEVPVGAVIVRGNALLAQAHNSPITLNDPSAHAEILAIGGLPLLWEIIASPERLSM